MLNLIFWKKVQEQKHPGRWEIAEHQIPSIKRCWKTNTKGHKHPGIRLFIIEQDTISKPKRTKTSCNRIIIKNAYIYILTQSFWTGTKVIRRKQIIQPTRFGACSSTCCQWDAECQIYASVKWVNIGSDNGLSPDQHQAIISTNAGILLIRPSGTNFRESRFKIQNFSFMKMHLKMSSANWRPFYPGGDELKAYKQHKMEDVQPIIRKPFFLQGLTHWARVTHICVSKLNTIINYKLES